MSNSRRSHTVLFFVRHDAATLTLDAGIDTTVVSGQLGHSTSALARDTYQSVVKQVHHNAVTETLKDKRRKSA